MTRPRVYFHVRDQPDAYHDDVVVLADGLQQLGCEVFGSANYWRRSVAPDDWLVRHDPRVAASDCDIAIVSYIWPRWIDAGFKVHTQPLPEGLFAAGRRYRTAFLDLDDGYATESWRPEYRAFDVVFRAKYNGRCEHPANHHPWALGLTARVLAATRDCGPWESRRGAALVNFGASHPYVHSARARATPEFIAAAAAQFAVDTTRDDLSTAPADPYDQLMWAQTQRRHSRSYYERLKSAQALAAFCGELIPPAPPHPRYLAGGRRARFSRGFFTALACFDPRPPRLIQWDSWRFWEGLAAGCLVFNLDLPKHGVVLPVMPEPFVHYVPLELGRMRDAFERLRTDPALGRRIAQAGRDWALAHYSPSAMAALFLARMGG